MEIRTLKAAQLKPADYNPRRDLQPEDAEYQKLRRSIEEFGYVEPIIWNERTGRVVGGHQRLKVLLEKGAEEIEAVVVDLDEKNEKILNALLNKVKGRWDIGKLADLLQELDEAGAMDLTGFEDWELQSLLMQYDHIKDLMEEDFSGYDDGKERSTFTMTFSLPAGARETVEEYMKTKENAKAELATAIINKVKGGAVMQIERKRISDLNRATYNPRIDLIPGDPEYENLRRSITTYGLLIPVIWNKRTNNVVGGHQRLTVLENEGETEVDVSVVDLDPMQERQLNVALNKIEGGWDEEKLGALLAELGDDATLTGFNQQEIDSLTNDIDSLIDGDTVDEELRAIEELFNVSLTFDKADQEELKAFVKDYGKEALVEVIIQKAKGEI